MRSSSPSTATVLDGIDSLGPPGTPLTTHEIAAACDCAVDHLETTLEQFVSHSILDTKTIEGLHRVWWRPAGCSVTDLSPATDEERSTERGRQPATSPPSSTDRSDRGRLHSMIFDRMFHFVAIVTPDGTLIDANESALEFGGISRSTVVDTPFSAAAWWQRSERSQAQVEDAIERAAAGEVVRYEAAVKGADRTAIIDFSLRPVTDEQGAVTLLIAEGRDISDRKSQERRLKRQQTAVETELSEILSRISDAVYGLDPECRFRYVNDRAETLLDITESTVRGRDIRETLELSTEFRTQLQRAVDTQKPVFFEEYSETRAVWFETGIYPSETGTSVFFRDITERKELQQQLQTETEHFRIALQHSPVVAFRLDTDLRYTWIGDCDLNIIDEDIIGQRDDELFPPAVAESLLAPKQTVLETGVGVRETVTLELPTETATYDIAIEPLFDDSGDCSGLTATAVDLTESTRTKEALRRSEERYRRLIENFPNGGVAVLDEELCHTIIDGQGFRTLGFDVEELQAERIQDVFPEPIVEVLEPEYRATLDGESRSFELDVQGRTCAFRTIPLTDATGAPIVLSIFHDITLRKTQQERQLATLDGLHETVQDIAHLIIESTTQADIESVVCDRFDADDAYLSAWIGRLNYTGPTVRPSTVGGKGNDSAAHEIPADGDEQTIGGSIADAVETGDAQLVHTSPTDPVYCQWNQSTPVKHRPGVVIPISYEAHVYGVLVVYTDRDEFDPREQDTLERLGTIVGHAINSIERKHALIADQVTEVVVRSERLPAPFGEETVADVGTVTVDRQIPLAGGHSLVYYTVDGIEPDQSTRIIKEATAGMELRLLEQVGSTARLELSTDSETIHSVVAMYGGTIRKAVIRDGVFIITARIPQGTDVRQVLDAARTVYQDLQLVSRTTVTPSNQTVTDTCAALAERLTDRQHKTLEVGYYAGYFDWPRETSGEELADLMDVTPATVHHHLRHGERKLLTVFFENNKMSKV